MTMDLSLLAAAALALVAAALAAQLAAARAKLKRAKAKSIPGKIASIPVWELDPVFAITPTGPSRASEVAHIAGVKVEGGVTDLESWVLCNLAKGARAIFEFGTATGKTTYLMARNAPNARIVTLTLAPGQTGTAIHQRGDDKAAIAAARQESAFTTFLYSGSDVEERIEQRFGDSKAFDEAPYAGTMDLIFIDGDHTESYVRSDTEKALRMVAPGGWVLWHDYRGRDVVPGVWRFLNGLAEERRLVHIQGTALVAWRNGDGAA